MQLKKALRALIVEDSEPDAELLVLALRRADYEVTHERVQTADALQAALDGAWDIVLSDYAMPGFSGLEALRIVKERAPELPFVIVSGTIGEDTAVEALHGGASDFLVKGRLARLGAALERARRERAMYVARERAEREARENAELLRASEERFRATFEHAAVGVAQVAPDGRWLDVNQRLCDIVGYSRAELLERTFQDITYPEDLDVDLELVRRLLAGEIETYTLEKRYLRKDGSLVWIDLKVALVRELTEPKYFIAVVQDISARKKAEQDAELAQQLRRAHEELQAAYGELKATQAQLIQSAKMASLGELVAGVAHEINNPLAFVLGHLDTVQKSLLAFRSHWTELPSPQAEQHWQKAQSRLEEALPGLRRIRDLVVKLRTFSRLDEGERTSVSMRENVESVLTILGHRLKGSVEVTTRFGEPDRIHCFGGLLNQALMNLVSNAIDAVAERGAIAVSAGAEGRVYVITVEDTGSGIPEAIRERVFEPFFTTKPVGEGTGLGLSITYSIVKKHDGTLELLPRPGGGTIATIRFPLEG